jgi:ring-1,2-phenylacetyl-CoA epoxidase subunit PaaC
MAGSGLSGSTDALLMLADTCLLWGHRLSEWCGHGPQLEEDIALTNTALDVIGQARSLYQLHSSRAEGGLTEDRLAYFRDADQFRNVALAEIENGDYAQTILRSLLLAAWFAPLWSQLEQGDDAALAAIARDAAKASRTQLRHAGDWVIRFGDGTAESRRRIEAAIAALSPFTDELLATEYEGSDRAERNAAWRAAIDRTMNEATLPPWPSARSEAHMNDRAARVALLAEMQSVARQHPTAAW